MKKSLLYFYLQKISEGDSAYLDRLCSQLADRLIFAPTIEQEAANGKTVVRVFTISAPTRTIVPVFTSEAYYESWITARGHANLNPLSLLCADFCAALGPDIWLVVDDDGPHRAELNPFAVKQIATTEAKEDAPVTPPEPEPQPPSAPPPPPPVAATETAELPPASHPQQTYATSTSTRIVRSPMPRDIEETPAEEPKKRSFLNFLRTGKPK